MRRYALYQHYADWPALAGRAPWALGIIVVQALVCAVLAWRRRRELVDGARRLTPGWRLPALLALLAFSAVVPSAGAGRSAREGLLAALLLLLSGLTLTLAALAMPGGTLSRWRDWLGERLTLETSAAGPRRWDRGFVLGVAAWAVLAAALFSMCVLERLPHIDDSVSYYFQAKVMAGGRLWVPAPPDSAAFHMDEILIDGGKWYGYGFPSWHVVLAAGVAAGAPWLVNPLLAGITVLLAHALVRRLYGLPAAHATIALLALSPWFVFMSGELLNHPMALALTLATLLAMATLRERRSLPVAAGAGAALGVLALARPLDAALAGLVAGAWALLPGRRAAWRDLAVAAVVAGALAALVLPYNAALTGHATLTPHTAWTDRAWGPGTDRLGFGADIGIPAWRNIDPLPGHGPADVVLNLNRNAFAAGTDLFGWGFGSLLLVGLFLVAGARRTGDGLMLALVAAFVAGYSLYWFSGGPDVGPRYWYPALTALVVLSWRGARSAAERLGGAASLRVPYFVAAACVAALVTFVPWRIATRYYRYRDVSADARRLESSAGLRGGLVFVRTVEREDYQGPFSLMQPDLARSPTIYARDRGAASMAAVVAAFPDRPVWLLARPHPDSARLVVVRGPLPPGTVPR